MSGDPASDADLLTSKFAPSSPALGITERPRLLEVVSSASEKRLTIVDAPAGYGKTTVLADWYRDQDGATDEIVAWLSLERAENDPALFWRYVVGALRWRGFAGGANAEAILRVPGADVGAAVRSLLNDLATADQRIVLILDDYHVVREPTCHELVADLLEHLPAGVRLIIATRSDPPLPLASLRVAGRLAEIRADDLRLTPEETASFVRVTEDLPLGRRRVGVADRPDGGLGRGRPPRGALAPVAAGSACRAPASSPATTGTSSTISASRSSRHSSRRSSASCCRPRS